MSFKRNDLKKFMSPYNKKLLLVSTVFVLLTIFILLFMCCLSLINPSNNLSYCLFFTSVILSTLLSCIYITFLIMHIFNVRSVVNLIKEVQEDKNRKLELTCLTGEDLDKIKDLEEYKGLDSMTYEKLSEIEKDLEVKLNLLNNSDISPVSFYVTGFKDFFSWESKFTTLICLACLSASLVYFYASNEVNHRYIVFMFLLVLFHSIIACYNVHRSVIVASLNMKFATLEDQYNRIDSYLDGKNSKNIKNIKNCESNESNKNNEDRENKNVD